MRTLEFRTKAVLEAEGGLSMGGIDIDAKADLAVILTRREASSLADLLETILKDETEKEFVFFTLTGAGRGVLK
jgi:hypothetical protein